MGEGKREREKEREGKREKELGREQRERQLELGMKYLQFGESLVLWELSGIYEGDSREDS